MNKSKIGALAVVMTVVSLFGALVPQSAKADNTWPAEVIASSSLVRFEVQPTGYDAASNKYKYKFSWLMPANRTYSFAIDGKVYMPNVKQNSTVETPYWFSPDITYSIDIYPYANGKGALVAKGSFKAPSVTTTTTPSTTIEDELKIVDSYIQNAPKLPKRKVTSKSDVDQIAQFFVDTQNLQTFDELIPYMSNASIELLAQTPLIRKNIALDQENSNSQNVGISKPRILSGMQYATVKLREKDLQTRKITSTTLVFIKEDGKWKIDYVQTLKTEFLSL
jgi:hypothetical protein